MGQARQETVDYKICGQTGGRKWKVRKKTLRKLSYTAL